MDRSSGKDIVIMDDFLDTVTRVGGAVLRGAMENLIGENGLAASLQTQVGLILLIVAVCLLVAFKR